MSKRPYDGLVTTRLPADLKAWVMGKASEKGITVSQILRWNLRHFKELEEAGRVVWHSPSGKR